MNKIISFTSLLLFSLVASAQQWQVKNLSITQENGELRILADSVVVPFLEQSIQNISYKCKASAQFYPIHKCKKGKISVKVANKQYTYEVSGWLDLSKQQWNLTLSNTPKTLFIKSSSKQKESLELTIKQLGFAEMQQLLSLDLELNGELSTKINAEIIIDFSQNLSITANYHLLSLNYEENQGDYVMADADIIGQVFIQQVKESFIVQNTAKINHGEALAKEIYVMFDEYPVTFESQFNINKNTEVFDIDVKISSKKDIFIEIKSPDESFNNISVDFSIKNIETLYQGFLASYFEIIGIEDLEIIGQAQGSIKLKNQNITAIEMTLIDLFMAVESKKINVNDLNAQLRWQENGKKLLSVFEWSDLLLAGMPIKASKLDVFTQGQKLWLLEQTSLPVFDGSLLINQLELDKIFDTEISIDFSGEVKPISLALITEKMGWPIMNGSISGLIPGMRKVGHSISFDGVLDIDVFEGQMQVENLSIERLFGIAPVVAGDITFNNLNLQQITSTFDFGEITGLVKGYIKALRITNWKADRLDVHLESVKTKGVKQTISQRAIDNISSIGGIQGALSRSFLRFFDYFKYKKIGFGCKLRNSICQMSGINDKADNYTLIEGRGVPSINIIGFRKFIDWEIFIDRLLNAGY